MPNFSLKDREVQRAEKVTSPFPSVVVTPHGDVWAYRGDYVVHFSDGTRSVVRESEAADVLHPESARAEADLSKSVDSQPHSAKRSEDEVRAPDSQHPGESRDIVGFVTETEVYNPAADGSDNPSVLESQAFGEATDEGFSLADSRQAEGVKGESPDNQAEQGSEAAAQADYDSPHGADAPQAPTESDVEPQASVPEDSEDEQHGASHESARQIAFVGVDTGATEVSHSHVDSNADNAEPDVEADALETGVEDPNVARVDDPKDVEKVAAASPDNQDPVRPAEDF